MIGGGPAAKPEKLEYTQAELDDMSKEDLDRKSVV